MTTTHPISTRDWRADPQTAPTRVSGARRPGRPSQQDTVVARVRPELAPEPELATGITLGMAHDFDDDDAFYAAAARRKRLGRAALGLGILAACWLVKVALGSAVEPLPQLAPIIVDVRPVAPAPAEPAPAPVAAAPVAAAPVVPVAAAPVVAPKVAARPRKAAPTTQYFAAPAPRRPATTPVRTAPTRVTEGPQTGTPGEPAPLARPTALLWSIPGGAAVMVDGRFIGRTPLNVSWDLAAETEVELNLAGYRSAVFQLNSKSSSGLLKVTLARSEEVPDSDEIDSDESESAETARVETGSPAKTEPARDAIDKAQLPERSVPEDRMPEPQRR